MLGLLTHCLGNHLGYFYAQVVESVDTPDLKSVDYYSRASSSLALGIGSAKGEAIPTRDRRAQHCLQIVNTTKYDYKNISPNSITSRMFMDILADTATYDTVEENRDTY